MSELLFLGVDHPYTSSKDRKEGYLRALREHHIPVREEYIISDTFSFRSGIRTAKKLLAMKERPTAAFAIADSIALGLVRGIIEEGFRVPEDIAVIGFDNIATAEVTSPALSTVAQPQEEIGVNLMRLLHHKLQDINCADKTIILSHNLICRETV